MGVQPWPGRYSRLPEWVLQPVTLNINATANANNKIIFRMALL